MTGVGWSSPDRTPRRSVVALALCLIAAGVTAAPTSGAILTDGDTTGGSFATDTLDPPSGLTATVTGTTVDLDWTASPDLYVTGYEVRRSTTSGSGYTTVGTPSGTTFSDTGLAVGTYFYVVRATYANWTSADSNEVSATVGGSTSTGEQTCTSNAADTGGDGNGYQTTPGNACADDATFAVDVNSGTGVPQSCVSASKDRHRFWGYVFGLPGSVSSVSDVTIRLDARPDATGGAPQICVQLSWDGGVSWTATQSVPLTSTAETTYTVGGTWGRTWAADELSAANFRVRLIDRSTNANRDFFLDYVAVAVTYVP
jgi:hypothetical protein